MADLRELIAASLTASDLSQDPLVEAAIDRVGALAFTDPLGADLWRLMAHQSDAYDRVVRLLAHRTVEIVRDSMLRWRICQSCVREFLDAGCPTCGGTGYLMATATAAKRLCPTCEGSRQRRYSDLWRAHQLGMGVETYRKWARRYGAILVVLVDADRATCRQLSIQLERVLPKNRYKVVEFHDGSATISFQVPPPFATSTAL